jgi:hypothetical protein
LAQCECDQKRENCPARGQRCDGEKPMIRSAADRLSNRHDVPMLWWRAAA